jgi:hypothetical protein
MSISLADALRQVDLRKGGVYYCQVGRFRVEVRVDEAVVPTAPTPLVTSDVMLDPWADLPASAPHAVVQATPGSPVLPDVPAVPADAVS